MSGFNNTFKIDSNMISTRIKKISLGGYCVYQAQALVNGDCWLDLSRPQQTMWFAEYKIDEFLDWFSQKPIETDRPTISYINYPNKKR